MSGTREQILDVARRLFVERGFDKTSLREVAEGVGVTKAALYYHFPSKEDLLAALLEPVEEAITTGIMAMADADDPEAWADGLEEFIGWMLRNRGLFELIEHNEAAVAGLPSDKSSFGEAHQRFHDAVDAKIADRSLPIELRVRFMCSMGTATSIAHFGDGFDLEADFADVRATMVDTMRACLGLPARRDVGVP